MEAVIRIYSTERKTRAFSRYIDTPMLEKPEDDCYDDEDEEIWEGDSIEVDEDEQYSPEFQEQGADW